ncbi:pseudouridine synthase [Clostridium oceanicum]|uniref:Pseudouridine synthase n=1 Tax=Clostridium oceanicum TaxID=1543 RepID=A0ABN1JN08_9CLOT
MKERLQKYMASCGVASRRKCEKIILNQRVKVNGTIVGELGVKVDEEDEILLDGNLLQKENNKVYILLNKPKGYISTVKDERNRKTILDLINVKERVYPIGRLDKDTSGIIILTNDGEIYNNIIHPREEKIKAYKAKVKGKISSIDIEKFKSGIDIGGYITAPSDIIVDKVNLNTTEVTIKIHEGKNRQIRRMCEAIGHDVLELDRISIGKIKKGNLSLGKYRDLTKSEIEYLKNFK